MYGQSITPYGGVFDRLPYIAYITFGYVKKAM